MCSFWEFSQTWQNLPLEFLLIIFLIWSYFDNGNTALSNKNTDIQYIKKQLLKTNV